MSHLNVINKSIFNMNYTVLSVLISIVTCCHISVAQEEGIASDLPEKYRLIRENQRSLALSAGIEINQRDSGRRSTSNIKGVPPAFRDLSILNKDDLIPAIETLYPYFGFTGSERLVFEDARSVFGVISYRFREFINTIETPATISILVDYDSHRVVSIVGNLHLDRDLDQVPKRSMQEAVNIAATTLQEDGELSQNDTLSSVNHSAEIVYRPWGNDRSLAPCWQVNIVFTNPGADQKSRTFIVDPDGEIRRNSIIVY